MGTSVSRGVAFDDSALDVLGDAALGHVHQRVRVITASYKVFDDAADKLTHGQIDTLILLMVHRCSPVS